ncbi:hypothetical protein ACO2Q0_02830 [Phenylobacterium sp. VNQ135]|uniref:hypothetical protein n=1 Tax=Phenylobacterium sp. VNQ135 TaxID=3400922 RepID=UPI003BFC91E8
MARRYTHTLSLSLGGDEPTWEGEVDVIYTVAWGAPEQGPSYASGGQPADPDEVEVQEIGFPTDWAATQSMPALIEFTDRLIDKIHGSDALLSELLQAAAEDEIAAHEDAMERRREERRAEAF